MLEAIGIHHAYGAKVVLRDVSLSVRAGEVVGVHGPSGVGKSTLARILAGTHTPSSGRVTWQGKTFGDAAPGPVQHVPQSPELAVDPRFTVARILANAGVPDPQVLQALEIQDAWLARYPAALSGGELARVSLARFILPTTRVLVCDEITSQLDALAAQALWRALLPLAAERGMALVVISHDTRLRNAMCTRDVRLTPVG